MDLELSNGMLWGGIPGEASRECTLLAAEPRSTYASAVSSDAWFSGERPDTRSADDAKLDCVWASSLGEQVVGIVGIRHVAEHIVAIEHFRVDPEWQHTAVVTQLLRKVYEYCEKHGCLKVHVEAGTMPGWMFHLTERSGFLFSQRRQIDERQTWEFYLDIYRQPIDEPLIDLDISTKFRAGGANVYEEHCPVN